jgi:hypothetical protein
MIFEDPRSLLVSFAYEVRGRCMQVALPLLVLLGACTSTFELKYNDATVVVAKVQNTSLNSNAGRMSNDLFFYISFDGFDVLGTQRGNTRIALFLLADSISTPQVLIDSMQEHPELSPAISVLDGGAALTSLLDYLTFLPQEFESAHDDSNKGIVAKLSSFLSSEGGSHEFHGIILGVGEARGKVTFKGSALEHLRILRNRSGQ